MPFFGGSVDNFGGRYGNKVKIYSLLVVNIVHSMYVSLDNAHLEIQILHCLYAIDVSNLIPMQMKQVGKIPETSDGKWTKVFPKGPP